MIFVKTKFYKKKLTQHNYFSLFVLLFFKTKQKTILIFNFQSIDNTILIGEKKFCCCLRLFPVDNKDADNGVLRNNTSNDEIINGEKELNLILERL